MKKCRKSISLLLVLCTLFSLFTGLAPVSAAEQLPQTDETQESFALPDIVGKEEAEEHGYVGRVEAAENDLYTLVFRNEDGTNTMRVYSHPVKYIDESGAIKDISLDVAAGADGSFVTASHEIRTTFRKKLTDGITLAYDDIAVTMLPKAASGGDPVASVSSDRKLVAYSLDERTSYEYSLTYTGFKEDIVVAEYTGQTEYEFLLYTGGLAVSEKLESYYLVDGDGNTKAAIGDIIVFTADERNNTMGELSCETVEENEVYLLTIHLDGDYLADERTAYPIRIDPSIEVTYDKKGAKAIEDVTINSERGSDGSSGSIYVGKRDTYGISRTLMKFPGLKFTGVTDASCITKATVEIRDILCEPEALTVECHVYTGGTWSESTASWTTVSPNSYDPSVLFAQTISYSNGAKLSPAHRYGFDITTAVRTWMTNSTALNRGIIFKSPDSIEKGSTKIYKTFSSYNRSSNQPSLTVEYENPALEDGVYAMQNAGSRLGVMVNATKLFTNSAPYLYTYGTTSPAGYWRVIYDGDGNYIIRPYQNSNQVLAYNTSTKSVYLATSNNPTSAMKWKITPETPSYYYTLQNCASGTVLASDAYATNNSPLIMATYNSNTNQTPQRWMFTKISSPPSGIAWQASDSAYSSYNNMPADKTINISRTMSVGDSVTYSVMYYSASSESGNLDWGLETGSDKKVVKVYGSTITANRFGTATVTAIHKASGATIKVSVSVTPCYVTLYGVPDKNNENHKHEEKLQKFCDNLRAKSGYNVTYRGGSTQFPAYIQNDILETNIFMVRSHGTAIWDTDGKTAMCTGILFDSEKRGFYSSWYHGPNGSAIGEAIDDYEDYSNIYLAVFIACETGVGGVGGNNLPTRIVEQGATAAIGFSESINCLTANVWTESFNTAMLGGLMLKDAVSLATFDAKSYDAEDCSKHGNHEEHGSLHTIRDDTVIVCGDDTIRLPN